MKASMASDTAFGCPENGLNASNAFGRLRNGEKVCKVQRQKMLPKSLTLPVQHSGIRGMV